jgi:hypothetical protein
MSILVGTGRTPRLVLGVLLAVGIGCAACVTGARAPDATPAAGPTGSPVDAAAGTPTPIPTPTPTRPPTPRPSAAPSLPVTRWWTGVVAVVGDPRTRITLSLHDCAPGTECGGIAMRGADGVGCVYYVGRLDPGGYPQPALTPMADEVVYDVVNPGTIDCEESWLVDAVLFVRPTIGGTISVSRVDGLVRNPTFTLDPAAAPGATRGPSATADRSTVVSGRKLTITIGGFAATSRVWISLWADSGAVVLLKALDVDARGAATVVVTIPSSAAIGRSTIWVEGSDPDSRETGVPISITVKRP